MTDIATLVPRSKFDVDAAVRAEDAGWPTVEPVLAELIEWCVDSNWPVAQRLGPFVGGLGRHAAPHVRVALDEADAYAKLHLLVGIVQAMPVYAVGELQVPLNRLAQSPSTAETAEDLPAVAAELLARLDR